MIGVELLEDREAMACSQEQARNHPLEQSFHQLACETLQGDMSQVSTVDLR